MSEPQAALEYRYSLPPHPEAYRTGAVWLPPDPRDYPMAYHPVVEVLLESGIPPAKDNSLFVRWIYDQGNEGSCVSWSDCSAVGTEGVIGGGPWQVLDGETFYHESGGTGQNGIDTRASLQRAVDLGIPLANSNARVRIGSYFFARRDPVGFILDCEAAVAANREVVVALLLPSPFGWESGENPTSAYHQLHLCGYDPVWWIFANSWGPNFGRNGFVRVKKNYITANSLQNGYAYAAAIDSLLIPPPPPPPPPPAQRLLTAVATGEGLGLLATGQVLSIATGGGFRGNLTITQISDNGHVDPPPPPPPPPGGLTVHLAPGRAYVAATVTDSTGAYVGATCSATLSGRDLGQRITTPQGTTALAAVWTTANARGQTIVVTAADAIGRTGSAGLTL